MKDFYEALKTMGLCLGVLAAGIWFAWLGSAIGLALIRKLFGGH